MPNICPVCGKDDAIQRISSIVSSGEASGTFSGPSVGVTRVDGKWGTTGGYTTLSGSTRTQLASKLARPKEPEKPSGFGCWWIAIALLAVPSFFQIFLFPGCAAVACILTDPDAPLGTFNNEPLYVSPGVGVLGGFAWVGLGVAACLLVLHFIRRAENNKKSKEARVYGEQKPRWDAAMEKYSRSYYCHRDDVVFDPETGTACAPSRLMEYLYSSS